MAANISSQVSVWISKLEYNHGLVGMGRLLLFRQLQ